MKFKLKDYLDELKEFELSETKDNLTIVYTLQSGDEVVYIYCENNLIKKFDSNETRLTNLLDELRIISLEELSLLNK